MLSVDGRFAALAASWLVMSWAIQDITDQYFRHHWWTLPIFIAAAVAAATTTTLRWRHGPTLALAAAVAAGAAEHLWRPSVLQSDVLSYIAASVAILERGYDPYVNQITYVYPPTGVLTTISAYLYPPGPLFVYGAALHVVTDLTIVERVSGLLTIVALATTAWYGGVGRAALAVTLYGTYLFGTVRALDGSDETTLALLFVVGVVLMLAAWAPGSGRLGRVAYWSSVPVLALALLFKQTGWPIYLFIALWVWTQPGGRRQIAATLAMVAAVMAPFLVWNTFAFLPVFSGVFGLHPNIYGLNVLSALQDTVPALAAALLPQIQLVQLTALATATLCASFRGPRDLPDAIVRGAIVSLVGLLATNWTSPAYFMPIATLLCVVTAAFGVAGDDACRGVGWADALRWLADRRSGLKIAA